MKRPSNKVFIAIAAAVVMLLLIGWMAGFFTDKIPPGREMPTTTSAENAVPVTRVERVITEPVPGSISAKQATMISSRIMSRITAINVRSGETVEQGQLLVTLEKSDLAARVRQAEQQINSIQARLTEAQQNYHRIQQLREDGVVSQADLDRAQANQASLTADLSAAEQTLLEAQTAMDYAEIRSPIDGRVVDRFAEPGNTASPGEPLLSLYNPLSLRVEAHVREQLAISLSINQPVALEIPALDLKQTATIEELVPAADPGSRTFLVKARFQFDNRLRPGMYARLLLPSEKVTQLVIPKDRVAQVGQLDVVWVLRDGIVERRFVRLGETLEDNRVVVSSGLSENDLVLPIGAED